VKKKILSALMISTITLSTVAPIMVSADNIDNKIEQSDKKINDLSNKAASAEAELASVRANIDSIRSEATKLQTQQVKLNKDVTQLNKDIEVLTQRISKRDATIKEQARSAQVEGTTTGYVEAVLSSESVSDAITRVAAASKLVSASNDLMKQQEADKTEVEIKKDSTEEKLEKINQNAAELESKKGELEDQELHQVVLVNGIAAEKETEQGKKSTYLKQKEDAEKKRAEQARQKAESERLAAEQQTQKGSKDDAGQQPTAPSNPAPSNPAPSNPAPSNPAPSNPAPSVPEQFVPEQNVPEQTVPTPPANASGAAIVAEAQRHIGKPYVWGAKGPDTFDCSGLTRYVYLQVTGRDIGGYTVPQESSGVRVPLSQAQPGDLLFWGSAGGTHHVAISTGGSGYIHAPAPGQTVTYGSFQWFAPDFAVRVL